MDTLLLKQICRQVRRDIINRTADAASGHPGGSLSCVEILTALYYEVMHVDAQHPDDPERDRFVLSKGHAAPALYAVLGEKGFFSTEEFKQFRQLHSILQGHPDAKKCPGVDASTGSLGQGISIAVGMALGARAAGQSCQVYCLCGDGEMQEGIVWEAMMAAAHYQLDNLTILLDNNGLQIDGTNDQVMCLGSIMDKYSAFGCQVLEVEDGNDIKEVLDALRAPHEKGKPKAIVCHTVKGKGISFMENQVGWHGKAPNEAERQAALKELEG